jgi:hypothetical protein
VGKRVVVRPRHSWKYNVKIYLKVGGCGCVKLIYSTVDTVL